MFPFFGGTSGVPGASNVFGKLANAAEYFLGKSQSGSNFLKFAKVQSCQLSMSTMSSRDSVLLLAIVTLLAVTAVNGQSTRRFCSTFCDLRQLDVRPASGVPRVPHWLSLRCCCGSCADC
jgi:hypothetical protein